MRHTGRVFSLALCIAVLFSSGGAAQDAGGGAMFRSGVDLVSVTAVVRDSRGRVVPSLTRDDFEVFDAGQKRRILDIHAEPSSPASVALLVDGSGSMSIGSLGPVSRYISESVLASLNPRHDEAALMTFDTRLIMLRDFTSDFGMIRTSLEQVEAWGSTSLYDAIAGASALVNGRTRNRRALVVLTDGLDNGSRYSPEEVSLIASSIDVPVYVFSLAVDADATRAGRRAHALAQIAWETGGDCFAAGTQKLVDAGIRHLLEELRHQYLISFEASPFDGLRRLEVRTRKSALRVRSRGWYVGTSD